MTEELIALADNFEVGRVLKQGGRISFTYNHAWQRHADGFPMSLSMPLIMTDHGHAPIEAFLLGLLPDNVNVLDKWAQRFHVSARNPFALMKHVGEDCAGAIQFIRPERREQLRTESAKSEIQWLTEQDVAERLRLLREDHSAWRIARDTGQFSLAGAQPKTALLFRKGRWGVPSGRTPTTHILKPPMGEWEGHAENEHFCLELAARMGLIAAKTTVERFQDEVAIVIERYDRIPISSGFIRIHQEDICQAMGLPPTRKYESEGGPNIQDIAELLRTNSKRPDEDLSAFVDAVAFNWLIAGTDAHAKNYSILIGAQGTIRLAPLYDVASILPYPGIHVPKLKMAMKIGGHYDLRMIGLRQWKAMATQLRLDEEQLVQRLQTLAAELPDQATSVARRIERELKHPIIKRLAEAVTKRGRQCAQLLEV
ncbi:MAG TPA: type II toxin-antitoxin system HipA family toxin [Terriglobales bacterium]|jgi:serine/threonine-protein kinase HipA|nr:type II toxin-antitoxin system HipA family toxin [Terriglobales bacterium]